MAKVFRPKTREANILSKIESAQEYARRRVIGNVRDSIAQLSNAIAMKLVENKFVETTDKNALEEQIALCLEKLGHAEDFDIDFQIAPFRHVVPHPHVVSLYVTAYIIEKLIHHKSVVDIFGSDSEIYSCINKQVVKFLPQ